MEMKRLIGLVILLLAATALLSACARKPAETGGGSAGGTDSPPKATKVVFADIGWDSVKFHNAVAMFIAETAYGLESEEVMGTTPITYTALLDGDIDVFMEMWTDNLSYYEDDLKQGKLHELSLNFGDNMQGFYVPRYVIEGDPARGIEPVAPDLKTVEDLKNYADIFKDPEDSSRGCIYGAISGWEVDTIMRKKYEAYGLDAMYNYKDPGTDSALAAAFASAYDKGETIVGYYWEPTWLLGKYDLVLLDDAPYDEELYADGLTACPSVDVTVCASVDFYESNPDFCEFLSNYETSSALTSSALGYMQDTGASYADTAKWFLKENDGLLSQWLPADKAELVRGALNG